MQLNRLSIRKVRALGVFLTLMLVTIAWATTTSGSYVALVMARTYLVVPLLICCAAVLAIKRPAIEFLYGIAICIFLAVTSLLMSVLSGMDVASSWVIAESLRSVLVNGVFLLVFASVRNEIVPETSMRLFVLSAIAVFIFTISAGGFVPEYPPKFVFSYISGDDGLAANYSQGVSKFFGLAAITSFLLIKHERGKMKMAMILAVVIFLGLSLLGGGRGDFLSVLFVLTIVSRLRWFYMPLLVGAAWFLLNINWLALSADFGFVDRYFSLSQSLGYRDVLVSQVFQIFSQKPKCLLLGCGIGYFQIFYNYPQGMYPHNLVLEFIVSFGAPLALFIAVLTLVGVREVWRIEGRSSAFLVITAYFFVIGLKSGGLHTSWITTSAVLYLAAIGVRRLYMTGSRLRLGGLNSSYA